MLLALPRLQAKERELQARAEMVTEVKARVEQLSMGALEVRGVCACVCLSLKCVSMNICVRSCRTCLLAGACGAWNGCLFGGINVSCACEVWA